MSDSKLGAAVPQLPTGDIERTAAFFHDQLGFEIAAKFPEYNQLIVRRDLAEIHFWQAPTDRQAREIASQSSCYITTDHIEDLFAQYKDRGVVFRYELTAQPWGMHEMQIDDPYGNAIRFGERLN